MPEPEPFFREAGSGSGVVCIHSNASTSGQWRGLLVSALPRVELLEFDGLGHMGPITHPEPVNEAIARFVARV